MPATFSRSTRSLEAEDPVRSLLWVVLALVLLLGWCVWALCSKVTVMEVSSSGRLEVGHAVHPVATPVSGRVIASHLQLGRAVATGEPLVELDAASQTRRLEEEQQRLAGLEPELEPLRRALTAAEQSVGDDRNATRAALGAARSRVAELKAASRLASDEAARAARLRETQSISEIELLRARAGEQQRRAAVAGATSDLVRVEADQRTRDSESRMRIEQIRREIARLEGLVATTSAGVKVLAEDVERHVLRAPASGLLGDVAPLQIGSVLAEGERVASVVPDGRLRLVAHFAPSAALGRIRAGQPARARLDAFPWIQWGSLDLRVVAVGSEPREGLVRVELEVLPNPRSRIPLEHGLPGSVEIEVERATPATLVLRAIGQLLSSSSQPGPAAAPARSGP